MKPAGRGGESRGRRGVGGGNRTRPTWWWSAGRTGSESKAHLNQPTKSQQPTNIQSVMIHSTFSDNSFFKCW
jgi:hypothetical protein